MIYGYAKQTINSETGLLEMKEVSIMTEPRNLRRIARFLSSVADMMDRGEMKPNHLHLSSMDSSWGKDCPGKDIIVCVPEKREC
jgi:hypothetical protein